MMFQLFVVMIVQVIDLIPNGRNIPVDDNNKIEYVKLIAQHRMTTAIRSQTDSFLEGFYELIPPELIAIFSPTELELLVCGLPDVDIEELRINTEYQQFTANEKYIGWFWDALRSFSREEKALFLQFVTGTSKVQLISNASCSCECPSLRCLCFCVQQVPLDGFAALQGMGGVQKFSIHRSFDDTGKLPTAHTCFNQVLYWYWCFISYLFCVNAYACFEVFNIHVFVSVVSWIYRYMLLKRS